MKNLNPTPSSTNVSVKKTKPSPTSRKPLKNSTAMKNNPKNPVIPDLYDDSPHPHFEYVEPLPRRRRSRRPGPIPKSVIKNIIEQMMGSIEIIQQPSALNKPRPQEADSSQAPVIAPPCSEHQGDDKPAEPAA